MELDKVTEFSMSMVEVSLSSSLEKQSCIMTTNVLL